MVLKFKIEWFSNFLANIESLKNTKLAYKLGLKINVTNALEKDDLQNTCQNINSSFLLKDNRR